MKLSIQDSNVFKGLAILMMLCHHLFFSPDYGFDDIVVHGHGLINTFAMQCKICVAIFVFVSGYGLTAKYRGMDIIDLGHFYWNRFTKLLVNYWFIWLIFMPISVFWLGPSLGAQYGYSHVPLKLALDFCGIIDWFGISSYNPTWWFYGCIIGLYILFPLLYRLMKQNILFLLVISIVVAFLPKDYLLGVRIYMLSFVCGMIFAYKNDKQAAITPPLYVWCILLSIVLICRIKAGYQSFYEALILVTGVYVYQYIPGLTKTKSVLAFFGRHSMDMFLTHTFIFFLWPATHNIVYMTSNPLVIYATGVILSLTLAVVIDKIKSLIGINQLVTYLRKRNS